MSRGERTPELAILALAIALAVGALLLGGGDEGTSARRPHTSTVPRARIARVARRVEALRGLRFERPVPVAVVSPAQARRAGVADLDRTQPPGARRTSEELLKLLGLLPRDADMRKIEAAIFSEQVAGYYDPRRRRLALVRGAGVDDVTLAHELTHALEDQHFDLRRFEGGAGPGGRDDDAATARQALGEGTATLVMERYELRWPSGISVGDALGGIDQAFGGTPLPAYVMRSLIFPYLQGERFVRALVAAGGAAHDWRLVNVALRARPPLSTAEILEPRRWLRAQQPVALRLGGAPALRAAGYRRLAGSTLGEEDVAALLSPSSGPLLARRLTAGWRGGRYALWRRGPLNAGGCAAPCRRRDVAQLVVAVGDPAQAGPLAAGLARWLRATLHGRPTAGGMWRLPGDSAGVVRLGAGGSTVRVTLAPTPALARRFTR